MVSVMSALEGFFVLTKTRNDLKRPETTYNKQETTLTNLEWPETT